MYSRRDAFLGLCALPLSVGHARREYDRSIKVVKAARARIGVTRLYDPAYVRLDYPGGDVPNDRGVCIDVVIRAYRAAFDFDFQRAIHKDMTSDFGAYPKIWGLVRPDRNIDHRRVPNMERWFERHGCERDAGNWMPGDIVTCRVGGSLPHIGIVSDLIGRGGRLKAIHNIGLGTLEDDRIWTYGDHRKFVFVPNET